MNDGPQIPPAAGEPNPAAIFETLNAHQQSAALHGAIELGLFTAIAAGHTTASQLASHCSTDLRATRILCDYLVVHGFLTRAQAGADYGLSPTSAVFLDEKSPHYMGRMAGFVRSPHQLESVRDVAALVRSGRTLLDDNGTTATEYEGWVEFARCMAPMMQAPARFIASLLQQRCQGPIRVLDIAAGHGMFGIAVAQSNPAASIIALDWPQVLEVARENAEQAGLLDRYALLPGDALTLDYRSGPSDDSGYDVVLVTNFFHHFDRQTCTGVMHSIAAALNPGGIAVTLEFIPDESRIWPPAPATFAFTMLANTPAGDAYTFAEYQAMWQVAGLTVHELHDVPESAQRLIISQK